MNIEERKALIYNVLRSYDKLSHNKLWGRVQQHFMGRKDSFSNKTFENTLHDLIEDQKVKRKPDPKSKLGKVWYSAILNYDEIEVDVTRNFTTLVRHYKAEVRNFSKKFRKLSPYDKALGLSQFFNLIILAELLGIKFQKLYPKNQEIKLVRIEIKKVKLILNLLSSTKNKAYTNEVNHLLIKDYQSRSQKILEEIK